LYPELCPRPHSLASFYEGLPAHLKGVLERNCQQRSLPVPR
jgi:hypothetical protein